MQKKGRKDVNDAAGITKSGVTGAGQVGQTAQGIAKSDQATRVDSAKQADPFAKSLMATKPGGLDAYSQAQYQSNKVNNATEAQDRRQLATKASALRGFGGTPGMSASMFNSAERDRGAADTGAYQDALKGTLGHGLEGLNYFTNKQQIYNPNQPLSVANQSYGTQIGGGKTLADIGYMKSQMPTTMGSIGSGLEGLSRTFGNVAGGMATLGMV